MEPLFKKYRVTVRASGMSEHHEYRTSLPAALKLAVKEAGREILTCGTTCAMVYGQESIAAGLSNWVPVAEVTSKKEVLACSMDQKIEIIERSIHELREIHDEILAHQHKVKTIAWGLAKEEA